MRGFVAVRDDHQILRWSLVSSETSKVSDLQSELYPLEMHWIPRTAIGGSKAAAESIFLLTSADGGFWRSGVSTNV